MQALDHAVWVIFENVLKGIFVYIHLQKLKDLLSIIGSSIIKIDPKSMKGIWCNPSSGSVFNFKFNCLLWVFDSGIKTDSAFSVNLGKKSLPTVDKRWICYT